MPPKKPAAPPPPQSDEDLSDNNEESVKKPNKKATKRPKRNSGTPADPEEQLKNAIDKLMDGSDGEDDGADLFSLVLPPRPDFLVRSEKGDRLMILNVEVNNFKSYYGKASIGPFHKSFTSIIGPNGSGKSNLIDSLLFVFGFRASKIRSAKVSSLIHNSGGRHPDSCTVTVHFQRIIDVPGHYEVVKDSLFEISRTAYKNGSSSYAIDGKQATKGDVEARLRLVDIDIEHNRFLILQGEVEQIAMMKPVKANKSDTGMVEYLEDIIGSNRYEPFVRKFQRRVNKLNCDVSQQRISRDHARASKVAMENPVRTAVDFLKKENEVKIIQMKLDQYTRKKFLDKVAPQQAEVNEKEEEKKAIREKLEANRHECKKLDEAEQKLGKERSKVDNEHDTLTKEVNDLSSEETRRKDRIQRYENDITKTESEKEKEIKKKANLESVPEKAEKKIAKWKEEVVQLSEIEATANTEAGKNLEEFGKRSEKQKEEQRKIQETWSTCNSELNRVKGEATVARDEFEDMKNMASSGTKRLNDLKTRLSALEEKQEKDKEEVEKLKPELDTWKKRCQELSEKLPIVKSKTRKNNQELAECRERLDALKQQNSASSSDTLVKELTREKEAGRIPGFIGRFGEMAYIEKKYEQAISGNFASTLKMFAVSDDESGKKILKYLFANKIERRSVRCLNKVRPNNWDKPLPANFYPGPRLFDLIECDDTLKPAFYEALGNCIVASTVKEAIIFNKMPACKNISIATLDGSIIFPSGNITGGGSPSYGLISTSRNKVPKKVTDEDRAAEKDMALKVDELKNEADKLREEEKKTEREHFEARRRFDEMTARLSVFEASVKDNEQNLAPLRSAVEIQEKESKKVKVDSNELETKQKIVEELEKKRDELSEKAGEMEKRQAEIQSKLDGLFKELVQCHKDEAKNALEKRQKLEKDMAKETANVTNSARNISKCDENIARFEREIETKRRMCNELHEKAVDEEVLEAKKTELNAVEEKRKLLLKEMDDITKKQSELSTAETKLEDDLKKCEDGIAVLNAAMSADKIKVKELEQKLATMKINRIPRFQFLADSSRPEDVPMQSVPSEDMVVDENLTPEETERQKKQIANRMTDAAYAKEFEMRQKVLENIESYEDVDGDKLVPVELLSDEKVAELTKNERENLRFRQKQCEQELDSLKAKVDVSCIETYVDKVKQYNEQVTKLAIVTESHRKHNVELQRLKQMRLEEFHTAFEFIGKHLVAVYKMLTDGGDAKLEYVDKDDPFRQGISFMVRPAKKAWKQINFLSGGEKTLSSLALIFALHMFRPTPFYVMDEIDAALDYRNVSIIAQYVRQKTENAQFIIISLRNNMFELANRLVGIYKVDSCTKNVAIDPQKVCEMAKAISDSLGQITCTLPDEVSQRFNETMSRQNKELTAQEKQYPNFPSSNDISKAEKIVSVEGRFRKEMNHTSTNSRAQSKAATERPTSSRSDSRIHEASEHRVTDRSSSQVGPRTPRKERNNEADETTPPVKRANSTSITTRSPMKNSYVESAEKNKKRTSGNEEENE